MSAAPTACIRARSLVKRFGPVTALQGVDVAVDAGETLAVLGPNGAGKSTLLRILAGLARPTSGELVIERDGAATGGRGNTRGQVGFAGHSTLLYPELTARENLIFHGRVHGVGDPAGRGDPQIGEGGAGPRAPRRAGPF